MITYSSKPYIKGSTGVVVGGGLLGLEAAKAMLDLENFGKVMIIDKNKWVLSRQLDEDAGRLVGEKIRELGVDLLSEKRVAKIETGRAEGEELENGQERVVGVEFTDGGKLDIGCICYAVSSRLPPPPRGISHSYICGFRELVTDDGVGGSPDWD